MKTLEFKKQVLQIKYTWCNFDKSRKKKLMSSYQISVWD